MNEPAVAAMVYLLDFLLILLELAAVLGIMIAFTPSIYSLLVVERDVKRAVETARRLNEVIFGPASPGAASTQPFTPPPVAPKANGSAPPGPGSPNPTPKPRHAPPFKPGAASAGTGQHQAPPSPPGAPRGGKPPPSPSSA